MQVFVILNGYEPSRWVRYCKNSSTMTHRGNSQTHTIPQISPMFSNKHQLYHCIRSSNLWRPSLWSFRSFPVTRDVGGPEEAWGSPRFVENNVQRICVWLHVFLAPFPLKSIHRNKLDFSGLQNTRIEALSAVVPAMASLLR